MLNRRGPISKLVGGAIGLTQEYRADRKEKKAAAEEAQARPESGGSSSTPISAEGHRVSTNSERDNAPRPFYGGDDDLTDDEEWALALDEAQQYQEISSSRPNEQRSSDEKLNIEQFLEQFMARHPPPSPLYSGEAPLGRLPMPVILPQRRPESRHRGFVRAYAPVLEDCGVDQAAWMEFLDGFEKSINANSWFHVLNAAVAVGGHVNAALGGVSLIAFVAFTTVHVSVETGRRAYIHYQQNQYLDAMNDRFFKPRGLYCLVIKYKPSSDELGEDVDLSGSAAAAVEKRDGQGKWKNLVAASASTTTREAEIPAPAPLVFPQLDAMDEGQKRSSARQFGDFLADYHDRQAAARFEADNPDTKIPAAGAASSRKPFASRYSDPNHAASKGGFVSVASGGRYNPVGPLGRMQQRREERRAESGRARGRGNRPLKKVLKQDSLYLMVVNMPSREEIEMARAELERVS